MSLLTRSFQNVSLYFIEILQFSSQQSACDYVHKTPEKKTNNTISVLLYRKVICVTFQIALQLILLRLQLSLIFSVSSSLDLPKNSSKDNIPCHVPSKLKRMFTSSEHSDHPTLHAKIFFKKCTYPLKSRTFRRNVDRKQFKTQFTFLKFVKTTKDLKETNV